MVGNQGNQPWFVSRALTTLERGCSDGYNERSLSRAGDGCVTVGVQHYRGFAQRVHRCSGLRSKRVFVYNVL